jgi:hypothetical protein
VAAGRRGAVGAGAGAFVVEGAVGAIVDVVLSGTVDSDAEGPVARSR